MIRALVAGSVRRKTMAVVLATTVVALLVNAMVLLVYEITFELADEDGVLVARVRDTGIGLPPHQLEPIFEMFNQADRSLERTAGGLGVGLALSRHLVELHGGTIVARSDGEGKGTEFEIRIPGLVCAQPTKELGGTTDAAERPAHARRILIVDDNADFASSLAAVLRRRGNEVRIEHDGSAGLAAASGFRPDWALLDIGMPGMNGYELARRLRTTPETREATLVAITGYGQPTDRETGRQAGFDHYLVKPVAVEQLLDVLGSAGGTNPRTAT